ncbi:hypothetical protein F1880_003192 [Penicillium rolfsii]|nr:hypothetical protein F1880_003192 [Penicillium rolfsii]
MAGGNGSEAEPSGLVNTLQGHVDDIRARLQCGICIRPLYEPFSLACGHTFCYTCLTQWFSGGRSKRTCPDCRAPVKSQPAPAYLIREIVHMFTSRAELLDKGETTHEHSANRTAESEKLDQDKANTHPQTGGLFGGLFKPKAPALKPLVDVDDGVMRCPRCQWELEEDACGGCGWVYRPDEDRTDYSESDDDDYDDETDYDSMFDGEEPEDDEFGGIDDDDSAWGAYGAYGTPFLFAERESAAAIFGPLAHALGNHVYPSQAWGPGPGHHQRLGHYDDEEEDEEEEDDYDEMDSFIDDEEEGQNGTQNDSDHSTVVGGNAPMSRASPIRRQGRPVVNLDSSDAESSDPEEGDTGEVAFSEDWNAHPIAELQSSSPQSQYHDTRSSPARSSLADGEISEDEDEDDDEDDDLDEDEDEDGDDNDDEDDEDEEEEEPLVSRARYHQRLEVPASSDGSEVTDRSSPRVMRPARHTGSSAYNAITIADSDEEQPVGPVRRAAQRRRARFSPY